MSALTELRMTPSQASLPADPEGSLLRRRRVVVVLLNLVSMAALAMAMNELLGARGWSTPSIVFMAIYLVSVPWTLLGFWNAAIGFVILRLARDPVGLVNPALVDLPADSPIATRTALCLCVRNEDVPATSARLQKVATSLSATGESSHFEIHVLSDTSRPEVAGAELAMVESLRVAHPELPFAYRRREANTGYKAGNLEEAARRLRETCDYMIVLDADSTMSGPAMLRLVRAMQAQPKLGILQTLVVGTPSTSAFTRIFQFGMRHGMRVQTTGAAWWQGRAGPYWGHNAIIRIAPFVDHCTLTPIPGQGPLRGAILSHDQVEAALMRGAGFEVRVVPEEFDSWEENPTNLPDFIKRDLRWCNGNLQYLHLLGMPGLTGMGRFQLVHAIAMYTGGPLNLMMLAAGTAITLTSQSFLGATSLAFALYGIALLLGFLPRLLGALDIVLDGRAASYGGIGRMVAGTALDWLFSLLIGPIMMIAQARFIAGLAFGQRVIWDAPIRADRAIGWDEALRGLWPQILFGAVASIVLAGYAPHTIAWASPTIVPCLLAVPFAVLTSSPKLGRALTRARLCAIPEELPANRALGAP